MANKERIPIIQDGATFYDDRTGDEVFTSSIVVRDFDVSAALDALAEFSDWASRVGLDWYPA